MEHQREFVEHFQYGKQIGKILDIKNMQKRHRAPKHILLGLKSEKSGNQVTQICKTLDASRMIPNNFKMSKTCQNIVKILGPSRGPDH